MWGGWTLRVGRLFNSALYSLLMFCRILGVGLGVLFRKGIRIPFRAVLGIESCLSLFLYGSSLYSSFPLDPSQVVEQALSAHLDLDPTLLSQTPSKSMDLKTKGFFSRLRNALQNL